MAKNFKALYVREEDGSFSRKIEELPLDILPENDVLIKVDYSSLNYKDALSATGNKGVTRKFPHIPGIDASGIIEKDTSGKFDAGDKVLVTGYDLGMNTSGGFGGYIRVPGDWVVPLPEGLDQEEAMCLGTAGLTAGLAVYKLMINGLKPSSGKILVTGATGGVGSMAVAILSKDGFEVTASTGKKEAEGFLKSLGASELIPREEADDQSGKPLLRSRWAGVVDNVGGNTLATALKTTQKDGCVVSIGMVDSPKLETFVYPFILNGITLTGVDSATTEWSLRHEVWNKLALEWKPDMLKEICKTVPLQDLDHWIDEILKGKVMGRIVVKHR
jgi:putative YhdH/YhfP family quinone oxidoreductase